MLHRARSFSTTIALKTSDPGWHHQGSPVRTLRWEFWTSVTSLHAKCIHLHSASLALTATILRVVQCYRGASLQPAIPLLIVRQQGHEAYHRFTQMLTRVNAAC